MNTPMWRSWPLWMGQHRGWQQVQIEVQDGYIIHAYSRLFGEWYARCHPLMQAKANHG